MTQALWSPTAEQKARTRLTAFAEAVGAGLGREMATYEELWRWSVDHPEPFWNAVWEFCGVLGDRKGPILLDGDSMPGARWFPESRLNYAENLLQRDDEGVAIIFRREDGHRSELTYATLRREVGRLQRSLRAAGLNPGDRVAAFLPNCPEAVIGMLATSSLGGVWSSSSPDFGVSGVLDRFGQIEPKFLLAADGYLYKGKRFDGIEKLRAIQEGLPGLSQTILVPFTDEAPVPSQLPSTGLRDTVLWGEFLDDDDIPPTFERLPFAQPLYILYSSGTTGKPKCIVHGQGGTLLQHLKEHQLHTDLRADERLFYFTTTGWMMWNWLVTGLSSGATLVLFDGNPFHPGPEAVWDLVAEEGVAVFGTSAKYLDASKKAGLVPRDTHDLAALRAILSTGSPLVPESFAWVYDKVKSDMQLASISGGTDIVSCFALGCPNRPVYSGELQCLGLGMRVEVWNDAGERLVGEPGELVCAAPAPPMPVGFWNDPDDRKYCAAYFDHFPGVWRHGDWVEETERGGLIIYGRSDATLNPGGVRIGTAEIYRQVEQFDEVEEGIVVGQDTGDGDQRVVLFLRLRDGLALDDGLRDRICKQIRANATPRHVPAVLAQVTDIPRTRSGKISEIAVRHVLHGREVRNTEALANPEALEQFRGRVELGTG